MFAQPGTNQARSRFSFMHSESTTWLVTNGASGSFSDEAVATVTRAFADATHGPPRIFDCQSHDLPDRAMLEAGNAKLLIVFAGDGTVNGTLTRIEGWGGQVLVLPGGTTNLLARSLHGETPVEDIIAAYSTGRLKVVRRSCIRSGERTALCEVLAGPGANWCDVREELRNRDVAQFASKAVEAVRQSTSGPTVRLIEPMVGKADGYPGVLLTVRDGGIEMAGYGAETLSDTLLQGLAVLRRDFREGPHDELGEASEITCSSPDGSAIELMFDGERHTGTHEERFSLAPLALDLLALEHA